MNQVQLVGRLTKDVDIRYTNGGSSIARFTLAVDRRFKREGETNADFISCVAFGKTAEFMEKYFSKGQRVGVVGRIQTGSYDKDGTKVYTTNVIAENVEFVESKGAGGSDQKQKPGNAADGFMDVPDIDADELPFN